MKAIGFALLGSTAIAGTCTLALMMAAQNARRKGRLERPVPADAVIILGAYTDGFRPSKPLTARLRAGLHLYRHGYAGYFIVSGGQGADETISEASSMRRFLILNGVPPEVVLMEHHSTDTWENLRNSRAVMAKNNLHSAIVVTSDYHLPRALAVARHLDMQVSGFPAVSQPGEFKYAIREVVARVKYTLNGQATLRKKGN
jgi:uncharacterized SAM-binding protein YcdF (DUF218 family)